MLALEAIGAGEGEGELSRMVDAVMDGKPGELAGELMMLAEAGQEGIPLIRAVSRRVQLLAGMAGKIADGAPAAQVVDAGTKTLFWKDQAPAKRQARRWSAQRLAIAADKLLAAERAIKSAGSPGAIIGDADLLTISRAGQRSR
jgi:DNA polymerase III subunit delta